MKILLDGRFWSHPKLARFARLIGRTPSEAGGYLARLWSWTAEYRLDGSLVGLEDREVCSAAGWRGNAEKFMKAARDEKWIVNAQINDWNEHQGKYIDKMMRERARKRRGGSAEVPRANAPPGTVAVSGAVSVAGSVPSARAPARGGDGTATWFEEEFWPVYPRKVGKGAARRAAARLRPDADLRRRIVEAIRKQRTCDQWTKDGGQFVPHPATWLRQERWDDQPDAGRKFAMPGSRHFGMERIEDIEAARNFIPDEVMGEEVPDGK